MSYTIKAWAAVEKGREPVLSTIFSKKADADEWAEGIEAVVLPATILIGECDTNQNNAELLEALEALVKVNETWNESIQKITGRPPNWNDSYLDKARAAIKKARGE